MTYSSLRFRLMAIFVLGMILLALASTLSNGWTLAQVRDRAIIDSSQALRQQAVETIQRQAQRRGDTTSQALTSIKLISSTAADLLAQNLLGGRADPDLIFSSSPDGWRYQQGTTTVLVPPDAGQQALVDVSVSAQMDAIFPGFARAFPEINRISFLAASGAYRTFPQIELTQLPDSWLPANNPAFQAQLPERNPGAGIVWLPPHQALTTAEAIISAVAPVYLRGQLAGVVIVDIDLNTLTRLSRDLGREFGGFGFVIDNEGNLVAAPENGQQLLLGRTLPPGERASLPEANPAFAQVVRTMNSNTDEVLTVAIQDRPYFIAYQPIPEMQWNMSVIAPVDQVTAATATISQNITGIADNAHGRGVLIALLVVALLSALAIVVLNLQFARPLAQLLEATRALATGKSHRIGATGGDELGQLGQAFNTMADALDQSRSQILEANHRLERTVQERTCELEQTVQQLGEASSNQQALLRALRDVSTPVIPIVDGVLAMPLIGLLDSERISHATQALLRKIEREGAKTVLLDITGVPLIDSAVAQALIQMVGASQLLGARMMLVGVTPEVAQTLVGLGIPMHDIQTSADIQSAIALVLTQGARRRETAAL
ncbi:MAG TPA: STAS domain-containing protein [Roseiflexaceae bacterium]|nr:STAS domain-containing protein [Roseiflexaceae bacterium]